MNSGTNGQGGLVYDEGSQGQLLARSPASAKSWRQVGVSWGDVEGRTKPRGNSVEAEAEGLEAGSEAGAGNTEVCHESRAMDPW